MKDGHHGVLGWDHRFLSQSYLPSSGFVFKLTACPGELSGLTTYKQLPEAGTRYSRYSRNTRTNGTSVDRFQLPNNFYNGELAAAALAKSKNGLQL
jgi:hypothetical protein